MRLNGWTNNQKELDWMDEEIIRTEWIGYNVKIFSSNNEQKVANNEQKVINNEQNISNNGEITKNEIKIDI